MIVFYTDRRTAIDLQKELAKWNVIVHTARCPASTRMRLSVEVGEMHASTYLQLEIALRREAKCLNISPLCFISMETGEERAL